MCVASRCEYLHVYMYMYISTVITRFFDVALAQDFNINEETCGNNYVLPKIEKRKTILYPGRILL